MKYSSHSFRPKIQAVISQAMWEIPEKRISFFILLFDILITEPIKHPSKINIIVTELACRLMFNNKMKGKIFWTVINRKNTVVFV